MLDGAHDPVPTRPGARHLRACHPPCCAPESDPTGSCGLPQKLALEVVISTCGSTRSTDNSSRRLPEGTSMHNVVDSGSQDQRWPALTSWRLPWEEDSGGKLSWARPEGGSIGVSRDSGGKSGARTVRSCLCLRLYKSGLGLASH